jgi:hypothetical protein
MSQQIPDPSIPHRTNYSPPPGNPLYAPPLSAERVQTVNERLAQLQRENVQQQRELDRAWSSPECEKIREIVRQDGNVDWTDFVKHCGGILEVVAMVDEYGLPDTDQIIPRVDELFEKYAQLDADRGSIFRQRPKNRPYVPGRGTSAGEAKAAAKLAAVSGGRDPGEGDAERLLRAEREGSALRRQTHAR